MHCEYSHKFNETDYYVKVLVIIQELEQLKSILPHILQVH